MFSRAFRPVVLAILASVAVACGGGGGSGGIAPTPSSAGGYWQGTVTADGVTQNILGFVSEGRDFHLIREDGAQFYGTLTISGNRGTSSYTGIAPPGGAFSDGSTHGTGSLTATIQSRARLDITGTFTTQNNAMSNVTMTVQYDSGYDADSALATVAGNYTNPTTPGSDTFSIANDGVVTYSDSSGCMATGTVTLIDAQYDLYNVEFTFANCAAPVNGLQLRGLLAIDSTASPNLLVLAMHGTSQGTPVAVLSAYERT